MYRFQVIASYLTKVADFTYYNCICRLRRGDPFEISRKSLATSTLSPTAIVWC